MKRFMVAGQDFLDLINGHVLVKVGEDWIVHIPSGDCFMLVESQKDGGYIIRKQVLKGVKPSGGVLFKDLDIVYPSYVERFNASDYVFEKIENVVNAMNRFIREVA